jgi:DNA-binding transcriptional ArsR family regulator
METPKRELRLTDVQSMRAMAHPMRMRILGSLRLDGPATAAVLARRLGTDSGQTSHHLRLLGKYGFIEEAADLGKGPRGRERWWRAAHETTSWDDLADLGPEGGEAVLAFEAAAHRTWAQVLGTYRVEASRGDWASEWVAAARSGDYNLRTTPEGLDALLTEIEEVIGRHQARATDTVDAQAVVVQLHGFPRSTSDT